MYVLPVREKKKGKAGEVKMEKKTKQKKNHRIVQMQVFW